MVIKLVLVSWINDPQSPQTTQALQIPFAAVVVFKQKEPFL
jgi:hypothetical protein